MQCPHCKSTNVEPIDYDQELGMSVMECQDCGRTGCIDRFQTDKEEYTYD